nr:hypothetical transcript [Hymenolepis microstoma]
MLSPLTFYFLNKMAKQAKDRKLRLFLNKGQTSILEKSCRKCKHISRKRRNDIASIIGLPDEKFHNCRVKLRREATSSPTETLLRLLLPLNGQVWPSSQYQPDTHLSVAPK